MNTYLVIIPLLIRVTALLEGTVMVKKKIEVEFLDDDAEQAMAAYEVEKAIKQAQPSELIDELFRRGISYSQIWGRYYEREVAEESKLLTVEDARLAGHPPQIKEGETF